MSIPSTKLYLSDTKLTKLLEKHDLFYKLLTFNFILLNSLGLHNFDLLS